MFFLQAAMAPVPVRWKDRIYNVPKMTMDELVVWATEVRQERLEVVTADMNENQRREHLAMYPPIEPDLQEMNRLASTPSGIRKILRTCLPKAAGVVIKTQQACQSLTDQEIEELFMTNSLGRLSGIAWELIDIKDTSQVNPYPMDQNGGEDKNPTRSTRMEGSPV